MVSSSYLSSVPHSLRTHSLTDPWARAGRAPHFNKGPTTGTRNDLVLPPPCSAEPKLGKLCCPGFRVPCPHAPMVKPRDALAAECDELHLAVLIIGFKTNAACVLHARRRRRRRWWRRRRRHRRWWRWQRRRRRLVVLILLVLHIVLHVLAGPSPWSCT